MNSFDEWIEKRMVNYKLNSDCKGINTKMKYNLDNNKCFFYASIDNKPIIIKITSFLGEYKFNNIKSFFENNQLDPKSNPINYIVNISKKNTLSTPTIEGVKKSRSFKDFIEIVETKKLYNYYLKPYYRLKSKPFWLLNILREKDYLYSQYNINVCWDIKLNDIDSFYLGPNCDKYFPLGMPKIIEECEVFPWQYICIYTGSRDLFTIRDLDNEDIAIIKQIEIQIKNKLHTRFGLSKENIIITVKHNLSSFIGTIYFDIIYVNRYNTHIKLKWEDDSDILIDKLYYLLEDNKIKEYVFFYGCHIKHTFFLPDSYLDAIRNFNKYDNSKLSRRFNHPELDIEEYVNNFLNSNSDFINQKLIDYLNTSFDPSINVEVNTNYHSGGNIAYKRDCEWYIGLNNDSQEDNIFNITKYSPKELCWEINKIKSSIVENNFFYVEDIDGEKVITKLKLINLFGPYYLLKIVEKYNEFNDGIQKLKQLGQREKSLDTYNLMIQNIAEQKLNWAKKVSEYNDIYSQQIRRVYPMYSYITTDSDSDNYNNFYITINLKSISNEFLSNVKYKTQNGNIDYSLFIEENNYMSFIGWYNMEYNNLSKKKLFTPLDIQENINDNEFINWLKKQRYQIINRIKSLFGIYSKFIYIKLSFHYPNAIEYSNLHIRIDVYKSHLYYYNNSITINYTVRNIYMDSIIANSKLGLFLPNKILLDKERYDKNFYFKENDNGSKLLVGGEGEKFNLDSWLSKYNSNIFFFGIVNKYMKYKIELNKKVIPEDYKEFINLKKTKSYTDEISNKIKIKKYINDKLPKSRLEYDFENYYKKFDIDLKKNNVLIIKNDISDIILLTKIYPKLKLVSNLDELEMLNSKYDLIINSFKIKNNNEDDYKMNNLKNDIKIIIKCLDLITDKGIISLNLGLTQIPAIMDFILLINSFSSLFILSDHITRNINNMGIYYVFSEFWKKDELKNDLQKVLKVFNFKNEYSFLNITKISDDIIQKINNVSEFMLKRYIKLNYLVKENLFNESDNEKIKNFMFQIVINNNIEINPESIPLLTRMLSSKLFYLPNGNSIKLHSNINLNEGKYLYNLVVNNKMKNVLEVGFAYGISAIFITKGLESNKNKNKSNKYKLVSIDPFQTKQWNSLGLYNLLRVGTKQFHKLYEDKSLVVLPYLLKEKKEKYDLIFIDGWHTFDYALVDLFYATFLINKNGYLILDDALHPGVNKLIRYIDTNYTSFLKKVNGPKTFGIYIKINDDNRRWDFHKDF